MDVIQVLTPVGVGQVWGIGPGKVLVEMDWMHLVEFDLEDVERIEKETTA